MSRITLSFFFIPLFFISQHLLAVEKKIARYPFPLHSEECSSPSFLEPMAMEVSTVEEKIGLNALTLEEKLKAKIYGQDAAVKETANAVMRYAAGVNDLTQPIASLLYCGPSGVGKTELAKQLALELYGNRHHFIRINMSEYSEPHTISRLIGSPPGYGGHENGGTLSNRLLEYPFSVVLLDEVEKAHPTVLKLFLHVFDAGYFTSARGEDVDCSHAIFILTSNIAAAEIALWYAQGLNHEDILGILQPDLMRALSPEMYNRLDCMIFVPLNDSVFERLINKMLNELKTRVKQSRNIEIFFDKTVVDYLKTYTLDPVLGARPLKRLIEKELATVIARGIMQQHCKNNDAVQCSYLDGHIILEVLFTSEEN